MTDLNEEITSAIEWINRECGVNERLSPYRMGNASMIEIKATGPNTRSAVVSKVADCSKFVASGFAACNAKPYLHWMRSFHTKEEMIEAVHAWIIHNTLPTR